MSVDIRELLIANLLITPEERLLDSLKTVSREDFLKLIAQVKEDKTLEVFDHTVLEFFFQKLLRIYFKLHGFRSVN